MIEGTNDARGKFTFPFVLGLSETSEETALQTALTMITAAIKKQQHKAEFSSAFIFALKLSKAASSPTFKRPYTSTAPWMAACLKWTECQVSV